VPTLRLCVLYGSQNKTVNFVLYNINRLVFITEVDSVYCAVRTDSLYKTDYVSSLNGYTVVKALQGTLMFTDKQKNKVTNNQWLRSNSPVGHRKRACCYECQLVHIQKKNHNHTMQHHAIFCEGAQWIHSTPVCLQGTQYTLHNDH
jgi:hypothetical protein